MKTFYLFLMLTVCSLTLQAKNTPVYKAAYQPFTLAFEHQPLDLNESIRVYVNRVPVATVKYSELTILEKRPNNANLVAIKVNGFAREGEFDVVLCAVSDGIEGPDSDPVTINVIKPQLNINNLRRADRGNIVILFYPPDTILYESTDNINWKPLEGIYNPYITTKTVEKKYWQILYYR